MTHHDKPFFSWKGKSFDFRSEEVTLPNGKRTRIEVVRHPGCSAIVPVREDRSVVLLRQYRPVIRNYIWEVPAGTMHQGEDPLVCARRGTRRRMWFDRAL